MKRKPLPASSGEEGDDDSPRGDITAIDLAEKCAPGGASNPIAHTVAEVLGQALDAFNQGRAEAGKDPLGTRTRSMAVAASETLIGAVEGRLKSSSLEGALKEAQILREYAAAARDQAEAAQIRFEMAWTQLQNTLALFRSMGIEVRLVAMSDGRPGIAVGDGLALPVPGLTGTEEEVSG